MEFHYPNESLPDILQPARVTSSSKTLIDDIFSNKYPSILYLVITDQVPNFS